MSILKRSAYFGLLLLFLTIGIAQDVYAQCTSPAGQLGSRNYFTGTNEYKFCNGADWIQFSSVSDLAACSNAGQWQWDTSESAYKYCNGSVEKMPGCLWDPSGTATCSANDLEWIDQSTAVNNPGPNIDDNFGTSVAVSGTVAVIGAQNDESDGGTGVSAAGRAYVFDTTDGSLIATLNNPSPNASDWFGRSVAVSGTAAVIGAYTDESDGGSGVSNAGRAYVFDIDNPSSPIATLNNPSPNTDDYFGYSVAVDGTTAVVGAYQDESDGGTGVSAAGRAYVFDTTDGSLIATLNNPSPNASDWFGNSVAVSGTVAVVGALQDESDGSTGVSNAGRAYVFDTTDGSLIATLNNPSPNTNDFFGRSVAISGTIAVIGAYWDESDGGTGTAEAGRAYVFDTTDGSLIATLNNPSPNASDYFGTSVAVSGTTAVVGAYQDESDGGTGTADAGRAYIFDTTDGSLIATLNNPSPNSGDWFGRSVAVSGSTAVVGAQEDQSDGTTGVSGAGRAYIFSTGCAPAPCAADVTGDGPTSDGPVLNNPLPNANDHFGHSVAISDSYIVVGASSDSADGTLTADGTGRVYVFDALDGSLVSSINNPNPNTSDYFGFSVAVSGTTVVVGAYGYDPGGVSSAGISYAFNATNGSLISTLNNPTSNAFDAFGYSVAISGTIAVVGAHTDESDGGTGVSAAGRAYVFDTTNGTLITTLNNPSPNINDYFGYSVAISGTTAVVGAYQDESDGTTGTSGAGRAYVFDTTNGTLITTLNNPNPNINDYFGYSVAISGTTAVVGAYLYDYGGSATNNYGIAYVFNTTNGSLIATLNNPSPNIEDNFGNRVAISGTTAVVGAYQDESDGDSGISAAGRAYVFDTTDGSLITTLDNPSPNVLDYFGNSISIYGTTVVIGAYNDESDGNTGTADAGRTYVFELASYGDFSSTLTETELPNPDPTANDHFGGSVGVSGTTAIIGAPDREVSSKGTNTNAGEAYIVDTTNGSVLFTLDSTSITDSNNFGKGVAISGDLAVVGETYGDTDCTDCGSAFIFDVTDGSLLYTLVNPTPNINDWFGSRVAISGTKVVVGAFNDEGDGVSTTANAGRAFVYDTTDGSLIATLANPTPDVGDFFGKSVAISGDIAVVGADWDDSDGGGSGVSSGRAYVFDATDGSLITALNNPTPDGPDRFGYSVAISGDYVVVGAHGDESDGSTSGITSGRAYVFDINSPSSPIATLDNPDPHDGDYFGYSVAISGTTAVVGAYNDSSDGTASGNAFAGRAYIFDATDGTLITAINNPGGYLNENFGSASAISGSTIVISAENYGDGIVVPVVDAGTAYAFSTGECIRQEEVGGGGSGACYNEGSCSKTGAIDIINSKFVVCNGSVWEVFAE